MSEHSLDAKNKRKYAARAKEWREREAEVSSQLKDFEEKSNPKLSEKKPEKPVANRGESGIIKATPQQQEKACIRNEVIPQLKTDTVVPRQNIHRQGTKIYEERKEKLAEKVQYDPAYVTITDEEILRLVNKSKGTGIIKINKKNLSWNNQETIIDNDKVIGVCVNNLNGTSVETSVFKIHYNKKGIHVVPDHPIKKRGVLK